MDWRSAIVDIYLFYLSCEEDFFNEPRRRVTRSGALALGHKVREEKRREGQGFIKDVDFILATAGGNSKPSEATKTDDSKICVSPLHLKFAIAKFAT